MEPFKYLISVIVSTYNSEKFIEGKIKDLINQTIFNKTEIIIINSGSQQNEEEIIKKYLSEYSNIKYIKTEERETIYLAWNRAIKESSGKYITNSNTDDRLKNDALEVLSDYLENHSDIALVYAGQYITNTPNETFDEKKVSNKIEIPAVFEYVKCLDQCGILSQPMWRSKIHFEDNIWFDPECHICGDHDFELNVAKKFGIYHLDKILGTFYYAKDNSNKSLEDKDKVVEERIKVTEKHIREFVNNISDEKKKEILKSTSPYITLPLPVFYLLKKFAKTFNKKIYKEKYFFTIEFAYFISSLIYNSLNMNKKTKKLLKKYLKYGSSERISALLKEIK